jgi:maltooligosyltrehalose trehalohydrolase
MTGPVRVWAPTPKLVEVEVNGQRYPMTRGKKGWWTADKILTPAGSDYGFILDGSGPFSDPRSPWQPSGVDGLSRRLDHDAFRWSDHDWKGVPWEKAIVYELHIGTFTPQGTFAAAIEKLDHLTKLGVTFVEIMPVNEFSGARGWGYDGVNLYAPHHAYGGPEGLKRFVDACHALGLAVILDVVYNHLGPAGNHLGKYGPYFTKHYASPWGEGLNFDGADSDEVRRFFSDNALMWFRDYHFDALRLDAVHAIFDASAIPFLEQLAVEVKQLENELKRPLVIIAESDLNDPRLLWPRERGGFGLHAQWSDDFHHALHSALTGERNGYYADFGTLDDICQALQSAFVYRGKYSEFRRRPHGRPPEGLDGRHFLGYLQDHDQVGNRAVGDRTSQLLSVGRLKIGAALVLLSPFVPMLFQGEEWGAKTPFQYFTNHLDQKLGEMVRQGRRREFAAHGWKEEEVPDPQAIATFERSRLDWSEVSQPGHADLLDWHQRLIALRESEPALRDGDFTKTSAACDEEKQWLTMERPPFVVTCNWGKNPARVPMPKGGFQICLASVPLERMENGAVLLPPDSVAVLRQI